MPEKILVVDDSETVRELVTYILTDSGFEVITADNGCRALEVLADQNIDMIVTDIRMPMMNGMELIRQIQLRPEYGNIPIIVISSETDTSGNVERKRVLSWINKPFRAAMLLDYVHSGLEMQQNVNESISC